MSASGTTSSVSDSPTDEGNSVGSLESIPDVGSPRDLVRQARFAGLLYLAIAVLGAFAQIVRLSVYAPGNAATTAANVHGSAMLVRLSFVADLVQNLLFLFLAMALYRVFSRAGRGTARALVIFVVVSVSIATLNMVNQLAAVTVATTDSYGAAFGAKGSDALVLMLMDMQHYGYLVAQFSWLWLFALGVLGYRSGMFPRWLSLLLMLGTVVYVVDALTQFLAPGAVARLAGTVFPLPETVIEVALLVYLLARGVRPLRVDRLTPLPAI